MPEFQTDSNAKEKLSGIKVGYLLFSRINVKKTNPKLEEVMGEAISTVLGRFPTPESILKDPVVQGFRTLFSKLGIDPTKERPSGEALIRRVSAGKGIYRINTVVDVNNMVSLLSGCPCGAYNADKIEGKISFIVGKKGESYEGIGGKKLDAENKLLTKDKISVFGGPTADSARTAITQNTKNVLMLIYLPPTAPEDVLLKAMELAKEKMSQVTGCTSEEAGIYRV